MLESLSQRAEKLQKLVQRGIITKNEANRAFIDSVIDACEDEESAIASIAELPASLHFDLLQLFTQFEETNYADQSWFYCRLIGDDRTEEELELDAVSRRENLKRVVSRVLERI